MLVSIEAIESVAHQIVERFRPERIILFGSYAYGKPYEGSDVDLLVIMPFDGPKGEQSRRIKQSLSYQFPLDLLARTPEEVRWRYEGYDPLIRYALNHGKSLYEQSPTCFERMAG